MTKPPDADMGRCAHTSIRDWRDWQCSRKGAVVVDGRAYCKQHDPKARQGRHEASLKRIRQEVADEKRQREVAKAAAEAGRRLLSIAERLLDAHHQPFPPSGGLLAEAREVIDAVKAGQTQDEVTNHA